MLATVCIFTLFILFTSKQMYAGRHFTGAKKRIGLLLFCFGVVNMLATIAFFIYKAIKVSFIFSASLLFVSFVVVPVLNRCTSKICLSRAIRNCKDNNDKYALWQNYNYRCDVLATIIALCGTPFNLITIIVYLSNFL